MTGLASPRQECPHQRRTWLPWSAEFRAVLRGTQLPVSPPVMIASTGGPAVPDSATSQPLGFEAYLVCRETNGLRNACGGGFRRAPGTVERSVQTVQCMDESRDSDRMESSSSVTISQRLATGMQPSSRTPEGDDKYVPSVRWSRSHRTVQAARRCPLSALRNIALVRGRRDSIIGRERSGHPTFVERAMARGERSIVRAMVRGDRSIVRCPAGMSSAVGAFPHPLAVASSHPIDAASPWGFRLLDVRAPQLCRSTSAITRPAAKPTHRRILEGVGIRQCFGSRRLFGCKPTPRRARLRFVARIQFPHQFSREWT